jgi:hypothetical protein
VRRSAGPPLRTLPVVLSRWTRNSHEERFESVCRSPTTPRRRLSRFLTAENRRIAHAEGRFSHYPIADRVQCSTELERRSGESSVHSRDSHPARTRRRIGTAQPKSTDRRQTPCGEAEQSRVEDRSMCGWRRHHDPTVRPHTRRGHARSLSRRVATARARAAGLCSQEKGCPEGNRSNRPQSR